MKSKKLMMLSGLMLSATAPILTFMSCGNQNDGGKTGNIDLIINPDTDGEPVPDPNSVNFNVGEFQTQFASFMASPSFEWSLPTAAVGVLNKVIEDVQETEAIKYQLPTDKFKEVPITLTNKADTSKTKTISFTEFLELIKVAIYKGDWSSNFSFEANYGFNLLDGMFIKNGSIPATIAKEPVAEFNNWAIQPKVAKENPLFNVKTNAKYKLVSAEVKTKVDADTLQKIEEQYNTWINHYKNTQSIAINTKIDQINRENKNIEDKNKASGGQSIPLKPVPERAVPENIVVPQAELDKFNKRKQEAIDELSKTSMDVSDYVAFEDGKVFLQKLNSDGTPIQSNWFDFLIKDKKANTRRNVYVTDYLKITLNIVGGNTRTQKVLEVPFKSVTQFNNLVKIVKDVKYQPFLKFKIKKEGTDTYQDTEDWAGKFAINNYETETKILEFDADTVNSWPSNQRVRFQNPDGTFSREFKNSQGTWKIDDNLKGILFKGVIKSGETTQFKVNVVDFGETPMPLTPRGFFITHNSMTLPVNTYKATFAEKTGTKVTEWLTKGTIVGKISWTNPSGETLTVSSSSLDGMFEVKSNGDVVVKADYLVKPLKTKRVNNKTTFYKDDTMDVVFQLTSNLKGVSESRLPITIMTNTFEEYLVNLKVPGNSDTTARDYNTWTIAADQKRTKGMKIVNLGLTSEYTAEMANLTTAANDDSKLFTISSDGYLVYNADGKNDISSSYNLNVLVTKTDTKAKRIYKYQFAVNQLYELPKISTTKGQDFNKLVNDSPAGEADGFANTYGAIKPYIKIPNTIVSGADSKLKVASSNGTDLNQYIGGPGQFTAKSESKTLPGQPFRNDSLSYIPAASQFTGGMVTKAYNKDETFTYTFTAADVKNIVLFSMLPNGRVANGPFRKFDDSRGKRAGFNSLWAGTWTIAEWKKYLEIKYVDSAGVEQKIDPSTYLITRIQEIKETDSAPGGDGESQNLQRISITLPTAVNTGTIKVTFKALPTADAAKYQKAHAISKVLFGT